MELWEIEPQSSRLQGERSTIELQPHVKLSMYVTDIYIILCEFKYYIELFLVVHWMF